MRVTHARGGVATALRSDEPRAHILEYGRSLLVAVTPPGVRSGVAHSGSERRVSRVYVACAVAVAVRGPPTCARRRARCGLRGSPGARPRGAGRQAAVRMAVRCVLAECVGDSASRPPEAERGAGRRPLPGAAAAARPDLPGRATACDDFGVVCGLASVINSQTRRYHKHPSPVVLPRATRSVATRPARPRHAAPAGSCPLRCPGGRGAPVAAVPRPCRHTRPHAYRWSPAKPSGVPSASPTHGRTPPLFNAPLTLPARTAAPADT